MGAIDTGKEPRLTYLDWDSEFFGVRIARVEDRFLSSVTADFVDQWCKTHSIDCLYFLADSDDPASTRAAEDAGYRFVDVRLTLCGSVTANSPLRLETNSVQIRQATAADIPELRRIASGSHQASRFYRDPNFPKALCDRLYEIWIEKSVEGYAEMVWVAVSGRQPVGYISCHLRDGGAEIGLLGVAAAARGTGVGLHLVGRALEEFAVQGAQSVSVVTQGSNVAAIRLYEKAGFRAYSVQFWYHKWFR